MLIGRYFLISLLSPFLCNNVIVDLIHCLGMYSLSKMMLKIPVSGPSTNVLVSLEVRW